MARMLGRIYFFDQGFYNKAEIYIKRALAIQEKQGAFVVAIDPRIKGGMLQR